MYITENFFVHSLEIKVLQYMKINFGEEMLVKILSPMNFTSLKLDDVNKMNSSSFVEKKTLK